MKAGKLILQIVNFAPYGKDGGKGQYIHFSVGNKSLEVEDESEKLNKAIEQHDWEEAERIKTTLFKIIISIWIILKTDSICNGWKQLSNMSRE